MTDNNHLFVHFLTCTCINNVIPFVVKETANTLFIEKSNFDGLPNINKTEIIPLDIHVSPKERRCMFNKTVVLK